MADASGKGRIDVLWARPVTAGDLEAILDPSERARLSRLTSPADRDRFATAHALLRFAVAGHLAAPDEQITFTAACRTCGGAHGKPTVVGRPGVDVPHVSLAHAGDRVVVALTDAGPVGIDVEVIAATEFEGFDGVALSPAERAAVAREPDRPRARATMWVRKEAALKATGHGLSISPADVVVSAPNEPARLVSMPTRDLSAIPLHLSDLPAGPGYAACLALIANLPLPIRMLNGDALLARIQRAGGN